jgi:hypothetical protein
MISQNIPAIYNKLVIEEGELKVNTSEISLREVFNCGSLTFDELVFDFEVKYLPYEQYATDSIDKVDLVVKRIDGAFLSPVEVKLTVMPDNTTFENPESEWGSELVVRSATTSYCALGMFDSTKEDAKAIRDIFEKACSNIEDWKHNFEMSKKTAALAECINVFQKQYLSRQKPILMQPIWKTKGKSPYLADNAFDIVIWSDYAFSRMFVDRSQDGADTMSRDMRATARLARCIWELSISGKTRLADIYRLMTFEMQNDKEFALSGSLWRNYVKSDRITNPVFTKEVVNKIIKPASMKKLRPERRLDQTLFFTKKK